MTRNSTPACDRTTALDVIRRDKTFIVISIKIASLDSTEFAKCPIIILYSISDISLRRKYRVVL